MKILKDIGFANTKEFITALGSTKFVAGYVGVASPSVSGWIERNCIPDDKLVLLAPLAERRKIATRQQLCPLTYVKIWPELAEKTARNIA